jgi:hypothetical protein
VAPEARAVGRSRLANAKGVLMSSPYFPHLVGDAPLQEHEILALPRCANCPFAAPDKDDGKLYCHESSGGITSWRAGGNAYRRRG